MNSLTQLNTYGQTQLSYTDDRQAALIFDRATGSNQALTTAVGQTHYVVPGIEITEIIKPDSLNIYYEIDVGSVAGATVYWASLPSGVVYNNLGSGKYRITNIDTLAQWTAIKSPAILIPGTWSTDFSYTASIKYDPSKTKSWTTAVKVTVTAFINAVSTISAKLTGIQKSIVNMSAVATISKINGGFKKPGAAVISAQATITAKGTYQTGKLRSAMISAATVTARLKYAPGVLKSNMTNLVTMITQARSTKGAIPQLTSQFTMTVINTDYFAVTLLTDDVANTNSYFGTQLSMNGDGSIIAVGNNPTTSPNYTYIFSRSGTTWSQDTRINLDASAVSANGYGTTGYPMVLIRPESSSLVNLYNKSGVTWTFIENFTPADTNASFGQVMFSPTDVGATFENATLIGAPVTGEAYVEYYRYDSGNPSLTGWFQAKLPGTDYWLYGQNSMAATQKAIEFALPIRSGGLIDIGYYRRFNSSISRRGDLAATGLVESAFTGDRQEITTSIEYGTGDQRYLAIGYMRNNTSNSAAGYVKVYTSTDTGYSWSLQATFTARNPAVNDLFGQALMFNGNNQIIIGAPGEQGGTVYIYNRSGTSWTLETVLRPDASVAGMRFGETVDAGNGYYAIGAPNGDLGGAGQVYVYRRVPT